MSLRIKVGTTLLAIVLPVAVFAGSDKQEATMHRFSDMSVIEGAKAELVRYDHGVYMEVDTAELTPGDAVTMWWVVFNSPENCSGGECTEDDVMMMNADGTIAESTDGSMPLNKEGWEAAKISVLRADGLVIDENGKANFRGHLPVGDTSESMGGPGLLDPLTAEVHTVIRTHGPAKPGMINEMVNSFAGGCDEAWPNEPCEDLQFAVFKPELLN